MSIWAAFPLAYLIVFLVFITGIKLYCAWWRRKLAKQVHREVLRQTLIRHYKGLGEHWDAERLADMELHCMRKRL